MDYIAYVLITAGIIGALFFGYRAETSKAKSEERRENTILSMISFAIVIIGAIIVGVN